MSGRDSALDGGAFSSLRRLRENAQRLHTFTHRRGDGAGIIGGSVRNHNDFALKTGSRQEGMRRFQIAFDLVAFVEGRDDDCDLQNKEIKGSREQRAFRPRSTGFIPNPGEQEDLQRPPNRCHMSAARA